MDSDPGRPGFLERLSSLLLREPEDREQLLQLLRASHDRNLLDSDALSIIEGALQVSEMQVREIMIPRAQMEAIDVDVPLDDIVKRVVSTSHSRFPVIDSNRDDVIGILLAKDLLRHFVDEEFDLRDMLRPAIFIPESKRLNVLLRDFRVSRNHMAIVVDEYGGVAGLVTIEDVLEQIVGDIEDEFDYDEAGDDILMASPGCYRVKATVEVEDFNTAFDTAFEDGAADTLGGLVLHRLGRVPRRGEEVRLDGVLLKVLRADSRRIYTLQVEKTGEDHKYDDPSPATD